MKGPVTAVVFLWPLCCVSTEAPAFAENLDQAASLGPIAVAAARDGENLYVAGGNAEQILVVDAAGGKVTRSIPMPAEPTGLVLGPDGGTLYVTCAVPEGTVAVVDVNSGNVRKTIPVGHWPVGPAISPDGSRLYVCNRFDNNVSVIDLQSSRTVLVPAKREPCAAACAPDGKSVFVINHLPIGRADEYEMASVVTVIDVATNQTESIPLPNGSTVARGICVSPDGKYVYVTHILSRYQMPTTQVERGWMNTNALSIIDVREKKLINTVLLDDVDLGAANPWGVALTADGKTICVAHAGTHEVSIIDTEGLIEKLLGMPAKRNPDTPHIQTAADVPNDLAFLRGLRRRVRLAGDGPTVNGPRGLAVVGSKAIVAAYFTNNLAVVDLESKPGDPEPSSTVATISLGVKPGMSVERRGEMLFNDATLCFQHWQSCATCHPDARVDGLNWDLVNDGLGNPKNARSLLLAHKTPPLMSLGVRPSVEAAVRGQLQHQLFADSVGQDGAVIEAYLTSLTPLPSPHLVNGGFSPASQRGKKLFFDAKTNCAKCHPEPLFTDLQMHDVGSRGQYDRNDAFDTPTLIECWRTAPYMHDGRYVTMKEVFTVGKHGLDDIALDEQQLDDLVAYVLSLSDDADGGPMPNTSDGGNPNTEFAEEPRLHFAADLAPPVRITAGGEPINVDGAAAPFLGDFDEDGRNDLLVGQAGYGRLRIYRNAGTNAQPKFDSFEWFKADNRIAAIPMACYVSFTPQLVDFDADGRTDILTGSFYGGAIYLFRRRADGTFAAGEVLENKHGEVALGRVFRAGQPPSRPRAGNVTVFVHDWDDDGDWDLVLGKGSRCLVPNEGTRTQPLFGDAMPIMVNGEPIQYGVANPCVADWDGDGRDDLLAGLGGDIVWYRNTGTKGPPVFEAPRILVTKTGGLKGSEPPGQTPAHPLRDLCGRL